MTTRAARGLGLRFDRVPNDEITPVHQRAVDLFGLAALDRQILRGVVAVVALLLGMARLAQPAIFDRELTVMARELRVVLEEGARRGARQVSCGVTR